MLIFTESTIILASDNVSKLVRVSSYFIAKYATNSLVWIVMVDDLNWLNLR